MRKFKLLRPAPILLALLLGAAAPAMAQVSLQFSLPGAQIGVNLGGYPTLQAIPGYPVYYAPGVNSNYFFYDGMYWVFQEDDWYASQWYNGPWGRVDRYYVPDYVLRVPVRYYRRAPAYFKGWQSDAPPRWDQRWGREWNQRRSGWDRWDRRSVPAAAPLPTYQREYRGNRYPDARQQADLQNRNYRYQPREEVSRRSYDERRSQGRDDRGQRPQEAQRPQQQQQQQRAQEAQRPQQQQRENNQRAEEARSTQENERTNRKNEKGGSGG